MRRRGFTLIEIIIVIVIIGVLAAIGIISYIGSQKSARDSRRIGDVNIISQALQLYASANSEHKYPTEKSGFVCKKTAGDDNCDARDSTAWTLFKSDMLLYLPNIPIDPLNKKISDSESYRYWIDMEYDRKGALIITKLENNLEKMAQDSCPSSVNYFEMLVGGWDGKEPGDIEVDDHCQSGGSGNDNNPAKNDNEL